MPLSYYKTPFMLKITILVYFFVLILNILADDHIILQAAIPKDFPPQYMTEPSGKPTGFAIDILNQIASTMDIEIEYIQFETWQEATNALKEGRVNLIPNCGITNNRKEYFIFSMPLETFPISIIVRHSIYNIYTLEDLRGKNVAAVEENIGAQILKQRFDIKKEIFTNINDALFSLLSGKSDALIYPAPVVMNIASNIGVDYRIKTTGPPLTEIKRAIAFRKSNSDLKKRFDSAINSFYGSPKYWEIYRKWHGKKRAFWTLKKMSFLMIFIFFFTSSILIIWRYRSIISLNRKLKSALNIVTYTESKLQEANETLEKKVELRTHQLTSANDKLRMALEKVHDLRGLLPICSMCKRVKDDDGYWSQVESYIEDHSHAKFSHGFCPECAEKYKKNYGLK